MTSPAQTSSTHTSSTHGTEQRPSAPFGISPVVFGVSAALILGFVAFGALFTALTADAFSAANTWIVGTFGWYYTLLVASFVVFSFWVGLSRHGTIRLGRDGDRPEFSRLSWFAMLFAAGMGIGLMFYGVSEPLSHFLSPPERLGEGGTVEAALAAQNITWVHWGFHAWAIYVVVGLAVAYAVHRRGRPLSIRWALEPLLGERVRGRLGDAIDIVAIVGTLFGIATSLGLGVIQINGGLSYLGVTGGESTVVQIVLIVGITLIATVSVVSGIGRGIKWLSNLNMGLFATLLVFVLVAGPTLFLLESFTGQVGYYLQNVVRTTFAADAFYGDSFQSAWTVFYWGWWISWAPFVGLFIARISKGRTVREFVLGVLLVPTIVGFVWMTVLGNTGIYRELFGQGGLADLTAEQSLFATVGALPFGAIFSVVALVLVVTFFVTSSDSGSLVIDMLASGGELEPPTATRVFWALLEGAVAIVLLAIGGLTALQTASIATALPFSVVMIGIMISTLLAFRREHAGISPVAGTAGHGDDTATEAPGDREIVLSRVGADGHAADDGTRHASGTAGPRT
jgi:choline/glycine/proline betaine transport protein